MGPNRETQIAIQLEMCMFGYRYKKGSQHSTDLLKVLHLKIKIVFLFFL